MQISVIIPTFNRAELLRQALESVVAQSHKTLQVIVVDDGSTDHTSEVLAEFGDRVLAIQLAHGGISAARNAGINAATGEYIAFLDSDDLWVPNKIEAHLAFALNHPDLAITYTDAVQFTGAGHEKNSFVDNFPDLKEPAELFCTMITRFSIPLTSTTMVRTDFLKKTGLRFPVDIGIGEDLSLFLSILVEGGKFGYLAEKLTMRRMHESNVSANHRKRFEQRKLLYTKMLRISSDRYSAEQKQALRLGLQDARYRVGECLWKDFELREARREFSHAVSLDRRGLTAIAYALLTFLPKEVIARLRNMKDLQLNSAES